MRPRMSYMSGRRVERRLPSLNVCIIKASSPLPTLPGIMLYKEGLLCCLENVTRYSIHGLYWPWVLSVAQNSKENQVHTLMANEEPKNVGKIRKHLGF